jgi:hypothetical protein
LSATTKYLNCDIQVCCPKSCSTCDTSANCTLSPECCAQKIAIGIEVNDVDVSCRSKGPPCVMPPAVDPCKPTNPCQSNARCGVAWQYSYNLGYTCELQTKCKCNEVGNDSGQFCEIPCGTDETACGYDYLDYTSNMDTYNDICCTDQQDCLTLSGKYGTFSDCYAKDRPTSCNPNPCLNGATCFNENYYGSFMSGLYVYVCLCQEGFEGTLCETPV